MLLELFLSPNSFLIFSPLNQKEHVPKIILGWIFRNGNYPGQIRRAGREEVRTQMILAGKLAERGKKSMGRRTPGWGERLCVWGGWMWPWRFCDMKTRKRWQGCWTATGGDQDFQDKETEKRHEHW